MPHHGRHVPGFQILQPQTTLLFRKTNLIPSNFSLGKITTLPIPQKPIKFLIDVLNNLLWKDENPSSVD
jgi:hypothetical protein